MKTKSLFTLCFIILYSAFCLSALAQGTAFTYQGRLSTNGSPASGIYDFRFKLYFDSQGNSQAGSSYLTNAIAVGNGLFTTAIDFGAGIFTGTNYWLEVDVKTNGAANYTVLTPLQPLTPTPYAVYSANAGSATTAGAVSGAVPVASLTGTLLDARLSGNVALLNANQTFIGANTFNQDLSIIGKLWLQGALNMRTDLNLTQPAPGPEGAQMMMGDAGVTSPNGGTAWVIDNYGTSPNASLRFFRDNAPTLRLSTNALIYNNGTFYVDGVNNRVGIGTTTPGTSLEVRSATVAGPSLRLTGVGGPGAKVGIDLATYDPAANGTTNATARIEALDNNWSAGIDFQTKVPGAAANALVSRLFIQNSGNVGIGTNDPVAVLDVFGYRAIDATTDGVLNVGDSAASHITLDGDDIQRKYGTIPNTLYLNYYGGNVTVCAGQLYTVYGSGVGIGTSGLNGYKLYVAGSAYSTGGWSGSDARWKKNVQPVTGALDKITQLQGVTYDWRRDEFPEKNFEDGTQLGFLAQDVEKVVPEAVRTDASGYKAIAYEKLTAVLTEGVKEQQAEIGALKARNATLEMNVAELKARLERLEQLLSPKNGGAK